MSLFKSSVHSGKQSCSKRLFAFELFTLLRPLQLLRYKPVARKISLTLMELSNHIGVIFSWTYVRVSTSYTQFSMKHWETKRIVKSWYAIQLRPKGGAAELL